MVGGADILTSVAICSSALILSRGETVISVLCVTKELALIELTNLPGLTLADEDSTTELQVEDSVFPDRSVQPEKTDSGTILIRKGGGCGGRRCSLSPSDAEECSWSD